MKRCSDYKSKYGCLVVVSGRKAVLNQVCHYMSIWLERVRRRVAPASPTLLSIGRRSA